jgi:copper chaperone CopZ
MNRIAVRIGAALFSLVAASWAGAETTVTVEKTHLCCASCVKGVAKAVDTVPGAKATCDQKAGKVTITAPDDATAQKAVDALVAAGYYGKCTGATMKDDAGAPTGNVKSLTVTGIHNCCKKCTVAINKALKDVPGATGECAIKAETFTITGDFSAEKLVKELNEDGFSVKVSTK